MALLVGLVLLVGCGRSDQFMAAREAGYAAATPAEQPPIATWFGVTTLLFDDGATQVLIDGFFSRPRGSILSRVAPDRRLIEPGAMDAFGLRPAGCRSRSSLAACPPIDRTGLSLVVPAHAHFDHVLDSPLVAGLTGAALFEGASIAPVTDATQRSFGDFVRPIRHVPESEATKLLSEDGLTLGTLTVRLIETPHIHTPASPLTRGTTSTDFSFPARKWEMQEGTNFAIWIRTEAEKVLVVPSGGDVEDQLASRDIRADIVFLGIGYVGRLSQTRWDALWQRTVVDVGASRVALVHWDNMRGLIDTTSPPRDLEPWSIFWLNRTWSRVAKSAAKSGVEIVHLQPGRGLSLRSKRHH